MSSRRSRFREGQGAFVLPVSDQTPKAQRQRMRASLLAMASLYDINHEALKLRKFSWQDDE